ncbi:hypothetical protein BJX68DRAFT_116685 [Aspergillus pseudodeflectus]|uniref:Uncharacterized protein n=1 Tax=Aspergillus pseudodeflectus TaxID=176178 RepID=A0ABR4L4V7_9EURO
MRVGIRRQHHPTVSGGACFPSVCQPRCAMVGHVARLSFCDPDSDPFGVHRVGPRPTPEEPVRGAAACIRTENVDRHEAVPAGGNCSAPKVLDRRHVVRIEEDFASVTRFVH